MSFKLSSCRKCSSHTPNFNMSPSFSEPTESPWTVPSAVEQGLYADGLCTNPAPLCAPTDDLTLEATIGDEQARTWTTFHYSEESFSPAHFHQQPEFGPRPNSLTYEVSVSRFPSSENRLNVPQALNWPHGTVGHMTIQDTQGRGSGNMNRKARSVCTDCNKSFGRAQELARHRRDVHEQPRRSLFCNLKWTRPSYIKAHLLSKHRGKLTTELLDNIRVLRGQMIVAFLDEYVQGFGAEVGSIPPSLDFSDSNVTATYCRHSSSR